MTTISSCSSLTFTLRRKSMSKAMSLFLFSVLCLVPCYANPVSYADHCSSIIPESTPNSLPLSVFTFPRFQNAYYSGGNKILNQTSSYSSTSMKSLFFHAQNVHKTDVEGVFKLEGNLIFQRASVYYYLGNGRHDPSDYVGVVSNKSRMAYGRNFIAFRLQGYWSESSGKLCMVGTGSSYMRQGNMFDLTSVLELNHVKNLTNISHVISGTLQSLSSADESSYFEPISILIFPQMNYKYTLLSKDFEYRCAGGNCLQPSFSLSSLPEKSLCGIFSRHHNEFVLRYASDCNSAKNCSPFGAYLPQHLSIDVNQCSENEKRMEVLLKFYKIPRIAYFDPNTTLVGEGSWDDKKNTLFIVACRIANATNSFANAHVEDCSIRLSLRFPAIWSIRETSRIVGGLWSNKIVNESDYFGFIKLQSYQNSLAVVPGLKYEYSLIDRVKRLCTKTISSKGSKAKRYPNGYSYDMRFDFSVKTSKGNIAWGYLNPLTVGDRFFGRYMDSRATYVSSSMSKNSSNSSSIKISYKLGFTVLPGVKLSGRGISSLNKSLNSNGKLMITAEGIYDAETGLLCMVGCRILFLNNHVPTNDSDCEIFVSFQFPPLSGNASSDSIKGSIKSTRKNSDSLYFEKLDLVSFASYATIEEQNISRMDMEIIMVLMSYTLACIFIGLQLFYVRKCPEALPCISLVMLLVLTLGYMVPLLLNFEALFMRTRDHRNAVLRSGGWLEANEVIVRVVAMAAFLLQFRLLQLTWAAKMSDGKQKVLRNAEKKCLYVSLLVCLTGVLISFYVKKSLHYVWGDFKSYAGLILDGFLIPQIVFNIFKNSKDHALSLSFYIGTTFVQILPHAYDLYRSHGYVQHFDGAYIYANPGADFFSTASDFVIPFGCLVLAAIIYLQQRIGDRCFVPRRFREIQEYDKVPVVSTEVTLPET